MAQADTLNTIKAKDKRKDVGEAQLWEVPRKSRANNGKICYVGSMASLLIIKSFQGFRVILLPGTDRKNLYKWRFLL